MSDIARFYIDDPDREHARLEEHQLEYDLTWRYLDHYLPAQGSILEVGAATGRYTLELAKRGYTITAVDLSPVLLEACRKGLADEGLARQVRIVVADARDLSEVAEKDFDAALLMGPCRGDATIADHLVVVHGETSIVGVVKARLLPLQAQ